jgi:citrate synthase
MSSNVPATASTMTPEDWWSTAIIDMKPGMIRYRGYAIEDLIGRISFAEMVYLMTRGELPEPAAAKLLEAALVAAVDHGPQAPSIAAARMAITCGVGINNAMASAINMLGDVHGGAGEQWTAVRSAKRGWRKPSARKSRRWPKRASGMCPASGTVFIPAIRVRRACSKWSRPLLPVAP